MKFELQDEGKTLVVTAETSKEVMELLKHKYHFGGNFPEKLLHHALDLSKGELTLPLRSTRRDNGQWFKLNATVDPKYLQPYMDRLKDDVGYEGPIPIIDPAPRYEAYYQENLCHTHIVERARIDGDGYTAWGYIESSDWNGKTAAQRAPNYFMELLCDKLGDRRHEPEYIPISGHGDGGLLRHNPNYLKRHYPHPAAKSATIYGAFLQWWLDNAATPAQKEVVEKAHACHQSVCKNDRLAEWRLRRYDRGWRVAWEGPDSFVKIEDFVRLQ